MRTSVYMILVIIAFFALVIYTIYKDENRKIERRHLDIPYPVERRRQERRRKSFGAYRGWIVRSLFSKAKN